MTKDKKAKETREGKEKTVQEKYIHLQIIAEQMRQVQQQIELIDEQLVELNAIMQSLDDFNQIKEGSNMLVPVQSGIFAKGKIEDTNELLVNVGSNVVVKKDVEGAKGLLHKRSEELTKHRVQVLASMQMLAQKAQELEKEIAELAK